MRHCGRSDRPASGSADTLIRDLLGRWLDEDAGDDALQQACATAASAKIDIAALLDWLAHYRCAPQRRSRAQRAIRAALRLPAIPGPVCRT